MIAEILAQYGAVGAILLFFMGTFTWVFKWITSNMMTVINNNTIALTKFYETSQHCQYRAKDI